MHYMSFWKNWRRLRNILKSGRKEHGNLKGRWKRNGESAKDGGELNVYVFRFNKNCETTVLLPTSSLSST
jgi:hypothetical protein